MNVPKYIIDALEQRAKHAEKFNHYDFIISEYINENNISVKDYDYRGGSESIAHPHTSSQRVYQAILNK